MISGNDINLIETALPIETQAETEHTLYAEPLWHGKYFTVTNSMINAWVVVLIVIVLSLVIKKNLKKIPSGIQNYAEVVVEGALNMADSVTGSRAKTLKFFPICFALFVFILLNNWLGILPGVGSIGFNLAEDGRKVFVPLFRGGTADLNTTLALALIAVIGSNLAGAVFTGTWNYFNKFINIKAFLAIPKKIFKDPTIILVNPIKAFVGIVEIIGEIAKVASLSFRLFGNIFAGEVLLASMAALFAFFIPIPFMFLEIIVGIIQALIFAVLTLVYLTIATTKEEH
ncbi:MAG: F0F1 ATP synthase subunit A [Candidatus Parcubacteria bacterium]|nr:F0F1 ATP synthase subunit A [Candidatus Parcubacteria bacterium]